MLVTLTGSLAATVYVYVYNSDMSAYCNSITMADVTMVQLLSKIQHICIIDINHFLVEFRNTSTYSMFLISERL